MSQHTDADIAFLAGSGEMAELMRGFDWSTTPLGEPRQWGTTLKAMVRMALAAHHPVFILWGDEHRFLYNDAYRQTLDVERHPALLGRAGIDFWSDLWTTSIAPALQRIMQGGTLETLLLPPDRGLFDAHWTTGQWTYSCCPIHDETGTHGVGGVVVMCTPAVPSVAARPERSPATGSSESRLQMAVESTGAGTFEVDLSGERVRLPAKALALFGLAAGEVPDKAALLERIHPDDRSAVQEVLARLSSPQPPAGLVRHSFRIQRGPHDTRHVDVAAHVDGLQVIGLFEDVTDHFLLVDNLRTADRRKDEFLATLAHELRNPLAALRSASYLLMREGVSPERLRWCGEVIQRQSKAMALLLDDLMEVSRLTRGKLELKREPVDLQTVVEAALETSRPALDARQHRLEVQLPEVPLRIEADPLRLGQVIAQLLSNAARYTEPGGLVRLVASVSGSDLRLAISDTGIGIAREALPGLFEMFHRRPGSGSHGGLGIGLGVSKGLIELHGGRLEVDSPGLGGGSTFTVTLPVTPHETGPPETTAPAAPLVLVADDNVDAAEALGTLLRLEGYAVECVHNGVEALEAARRHQPFAAFLDIGMPGLDGYRLATQIRSKPWGEQLYLVAMTGWGQGADRDRAMAAGFDVHLTKPVDPERVTELLAKHLGTKRPTPS